MSSEQIGRGQRVLDAILRELDEGRLRTRIDDRIETVLRGFVDFLEHSCDGRTPGEVFSIFVQRVYREGLGRPWTLASAEATSLTLLENHYQGMRASGYFAAVLDATNLETGGMTLVLTQLAEIIRTRERRECTEAVFTRHIDPTDWRLRCEIVEILLKQYRLFLPPTVLECAPSQLVDEIPALMLSIMGSSATVGTLTTLRREKAE